MRYSAPRSSVIEQAVEGIAGMIRTGAYAPGDRLPGERQLAQQLHIGRTSVREAIRRLEALGMVESRQGLGTYVNDPGRRTLQSALAPSILTDRDTLEELFAIREIMEIEASGRAAGRAQPGQIQAMRVWAEAVETAVAQGDAEGIVTGDVEFHRQIMAATGNQALQRLMDSVVDLLRNTRYDSTIIPQHLPEIVSGHRAILQAIECGDGAAARQAMRAHLAEIGQWARAYWAGSQGQQP
jgi:GntR family transcriptional repressor for pyruvate dehydrogenase complex